MSPDAAQRSVLRAADELFYAHGISGVVMSDIRDASGVSMRRLYGMYPSKSELVAAWLTDRHDTWMAWFAASVERHVSGGADPVLATFDAIAEWVTTPGYRGCAFINSLAETSEIDETHSTIIAAHKRDLVEHLAQLAARDHPNAPSWFPAALAVIIDGVIVQCTIFASTDPLDAARSAVHQLLETTST
ncbi:MAG: TetR/AcrR family transcriptional regulator [Actinomycetota bacterium]|nr:TetR/AcrR family transcriptional regulator [Actinomycetota bacterium]